MAENGSAWWPGEVQQYAKLAGFVAGTNGTLIQKLPLEWAFRRDKDRVGVAKQYATQPIDLTTWNAGKNGLTLRNRKDYPDAWELLRTDLLSINLSRLNRPDQT